MNNFSLLQTESIDEAFNSKITNKNSQFIGGGTNLVDLMKYGVERPEHLIDINNLNLSQILELDNGGLRLGATVSNAKTAYNEIVKSRYPLLSKAILSGASAQLRNMATNGGNLMQRTRCYYFYDTAMPCNKRVPGSGCSALNGFNRIHAILGANENCIATHPSDMCVALAALDATVNLKDSEGERSIPFLDFHRLPGDKPHIDNNKKENEIITSIDLPQEGFAEHFSYLKVRDRPSYAFALISVAAALTIEDSKIKDLRVALGGVAHKPWRNVELEKEFIDKEIEEETFKKFAELLLVGAKGYGHNNFKIPLAKKTIIRSLIEASNKQ